MRTVPESVEASLGPRGDAVRTQGVEEEGAHGVTGAENQSDVFEEQGATEKHQRRRTRRRSTPNCLSKKPYGPGLTLFTAATLIVTGVCGISLLAGIAAKEPLGGEKLLSPTRKAQASLASPPFPQQLSAALIVLVILFCFGITNDTSGENKTKGAAAGAARRRP